MMYVISMSRLSQFVPRQFSLAFLAVGLIPGLLQAAPANLRGSLGIHDPSAVIKCGNLYYVFGTGARHQFKIFRRQNVLDDRA